MKKLLVTIGLLVASFGFFYFLKPAVSNAPTKPSIPTSTAPSSKTKQVTIPTLSLNGIFDNKIDVEGLDISKIIKLIATGDVIPARGANWPAVTSGDFTYNWKKTASFLKSGDLTLINLEAPLIKNCPLLTSGFTFCGDSRHIKGLLFAGVDVASLSNNHIGNFGDSGIDETINLLEANKIGWSGFSHLDIEKVKGVKFGFLAYNGIGTSLDLPAIKKEVSASKKKVDVLVISIHWGKEYELVPTTAGNIAPDDPKKVGPALIDAGADLVIGNHPHVVQGIQIYKPRSGLRSDELNNKLIAYAHGNFIFDQTWSQETQEGVVGEYIFYGKKLIDVRYHPILVNVSYQPRFLSEKEGKHILDRMLKSTKEIMSSKR